MSQVVADLLLLLITIIWGTTFVIVKEATVSIKPFTFLAVRFFVGSFALLFWLALRRMWRSNRTRGEADGHFDHAAGGVSDAVGGALDCFRTRKVLVNGAVITGVTLFLAYATQTIGLLTVAAGKAAFITGLSVVLVPVGSAVLLRVVPEINAAIGVFLATIGLGVMSLTLPFRVETGDVLIFLCAIGFAAHILLVGIHSKHGDPAIFAAIQLMIVAVGSLVAALCLEQPLVVPREAWGAIIYTGIVATAVTVLVQSTVQKYTSATHAALIYSAEPVFAAFFGWLMLGEVLSPREAVGAVLILAGMLVSELAPGKKQPAAQEQAAVSDQRF